VMTATPKVSSRPVTRGMSVPDIRGGSGLSAIPEVSPTSRGLSLPPNSTHISSVTPNRDGHTTPPSTHSHNPLPRPPYEVHHPAAAASPMRIPTPPPGSYSSRVRLGFWNRRGDHLTRTMHVVYAPPEKAYPRELQGYPAETEGFRDHLGTFVPYNPDRPELPESLPRHGKPPMQPYSIVSLFQRMISRHSCSISVRGIRIQKVVARRGNKARQPISCMLMAAMAALQSKWLTKRT
jgi:hypothetical protein